MSRTPAAWLPLALITLSLAAGGCSPAPAPEPQDQVIPESPGRSAPVDAPDPPGPSDPLAGTWYLLAPSHPYLALRLNLVATEDSEALEGHWISFDWRASRQAEALVRRSKAVLVLARRTGSRELPSALVIEGAMPMLDENGSPNGQGGTWHIELARAGLPGESLRFRGQGLHTTLAGQESVAVDLVREFRAWAP